jgi:hypothetical protein
MKKTIFLILTMLPLAACNGWVIQRGPFNPPTPFLPPTNTPSVFTATPVVIGVASATQTPQIATLTPIPFITATTAPTLIPSDTPLPTTTQTSPPSGPSVAVEVLGCDTSIDVTHGMGEVTNAYVVVSNTGGIELTNLRVTLKALDEGREHPDKSFEIRSLAPAYKVQLKLTVDSTYQEETPIQVELNGDAGFFQRTGAASCKDIGVFAPNPNDLGTPMPGNP